MPKKTGPKFKLPPIRPEKESLIAFVSFGKGQTSPTIPKDHSRLHPELDLIKEQKKCEGLSDRLWRHRINSEQIQQKLKIQWKQLEKNEFFLQRTIIIHNRFLQRNLEKRERALAKMQTDRELASKREKEIKALDKKYDFFHSILTKMRSEIKNHSIYEQYLNAVVEQVECPFKIPFEFLMKYESLQLVKQHCVKRQTEEMATTVMLHDDNVEFFRLRDVVLIGLRNDLNNLRCKFEDICRKNLATESLITSIVNRTNQLSSEVSSCQYMIDAIYRYICQRRKIPQADFALNDVQAKIDVLKSTLGAWEKILAMPELTRRKKSLKYGRKSYKGSIAQPLFLWRKKASMLAELAAGVGEKLDKM